MTSKASKKILSLGDQLTNSLWSFFMMRMVYSNFQGRDIALFGITVIFAYSCSGLLRSKYVYPFYGTFRDNDVNVKFDIFEILNISTIKYLSIFTITFFAYLQVNNPKSMNFTLELCTLMISIVLLDLFRSLIQLNADFFFAIFINIVGFLLFLGLQVVQLRISTSNIIFSSIDSWIICNFIVSLIAFRFLQRLRKNHINNTSTFSVSTLNLEKISNLSQNEFIFNRIMNLIGSSLLIQMNLQNSVGLTLALFAYSTLPFSVLNGLSPYYFRTRGKSASEFPLNRFFSYIGVSSLVVPIISIFLPNFFSYVFGFMPSASQNLLLIALLIVAQKSHESATSLDFMIASSKKRYIKVKLMIALVVNLIVPFFLGLGAIHLSAITLIALIVYQSRSLRRSTK